MERGGGGKHKHTTCINSEQRFPSTFVNYLGCVISEHFESTLKYLQGFLTVIFELYLQLERRFEINIVLHGNMQK